MHRVAVQGLDTAEQMRALGKRVLILALADNPMTEAPAHVVCGEIAKRTSATKAVFFRRLQCVSQARTTDK